MMVMINFLTKPINSNEGAGPAHSCTASHHYQDDHDEDDDDDDDDVGDGDSEDDDFMPMYGADLQCTTMGSSPGLMCSLKSRTNL